MGDDSNHRLRLFNWIGETTVILYLYHPFLCFKIEKAQPIDIHAYCQDVADLIGMLRTGTHAEGIVRAAEVGEIEIGLRTYGLDGSDFNFFEI